LKILYGFRCPNGEELEAFFYMAEAPASITCPYHNAEATRLPSRGAFLTVPGGYNSTRK